MARMLVCSASSETMSSTRADLLRLLAQLEHVADDQVDLAADAGDRLVRDADGAVAGCAPRSPVWSAICATRCALSAICREVASSSLIVVADLAHRRGLLLRAGRLLGGGGLQLGRRALDLRRPPCRSAGSATRARTNAVAAPSSATSTAIAMISRWALAAASEAAFVASARWARVSATNERSASSSSSRIGSSPSNARTTWSSGASVRRRATTCSTAVWCRCSSRSMALTSSPAWSDAPPRSSAATARAISARALAQLAQGGLAAGVRKNWRVALALRCRRRHQRVGLDQRPRVHVDDAVLVLRPPCAAPAPRRRR